jgi:Mn-dependent DtxR family transcriptional regulator
MEGLMSIHESGENYLEQLLLLSKEKEKVRAVDLCAALGFSRPTVSVMLRELRAGGFVSVADNGALALTEKGAALANKIYERHCLICESLVALGVSRETAKADACKIEHDISEETLDCLRAHLERVKGKCNA